MQGQDLGVIIILETGAAIDIQNFFHRIGIQLLVNESYQTRKFHIAGLLGS